MLNQLNLEPRFVKGVPRDLEMGVLYVSMEYATVVHSCCCGCGLEVALPLSPVHWQLTYDGESISLFPSVGSWNLPCKSHYVIRRNQVIEAAPWTQRQIDSAQAREQAERDTYFRSTSSAVPPVATQGERGTTQPEASRESRGTNFWRSEAGWLVRWLNRWRR